MQKATITVSEGRFPEAHFDGRRTPEPTIGYALTRLADEARTRNTKIRVEVEDGLSRLLLLIDAQGRLHVQQPVPPRPAFPPPPGHSPPRPRTSGLTPATAERLGLTDIRSAQGSRDPHGALSLPHPLHGRTFAADGTLSPALTRPLPLTPPLPKIPDSRHAYPEVSLAAPIRPLRTEPSDLPESPATTAGNGPATPGGKQRWKLLAAVTAVALLAGSAVLLLTRPDTAPHDDGAAATPLTDRGPSVVLSLAPSVTAGEPTEEPSGVPGLDTEQWVEALSPGSSVTATAEGLVVLDRGAITVLDATTGAERFTATFDDPVTLVADVLVDGAPALVWRSSDTLRALLNGADEPIEYAIDEDAAISAAGTSALIREGDTLSTLGTDGLVPLPTPPIGHTPIAIDGTTLVSGSLDGSLTLAESAGDTTDLTLTPPGDDFVLDEWKAAGHGLAVTLWSRADTEDPRIAVHSLADGSLSAVAAAPADLVSDAEWAVGQGDVLGILGPYVFALETGELLIDGSADGITFSTAHGDLVIGEGDAGTLVVTGALDGSPVSHTTEADLVAVASDPQIAIVRTETALEGYVSDGE